MNRVTRALFRSFLRWTRQPELINNPFILNPTALNISKLLPPGVQLHGQEGVQAAIFHCFRHHSYSSQHLDVALTVLKKLNELSQVLKRRLASQQVNVHYNRNYTRYIDYQLGQVVQHKQKHVRAVVIGWEIDIEQKKQKIKLLYDTSDFNEFITSTEELAMIVNSDEVIEVTDRLYKSIHHSEIGNYFSHYDEKTGRYVPLEDFAFLYPYDVLDQPYQRSLLSQDGLLAANHMMKEIEELQQKMVEIMEDAFPGLWQDFVANQKVTDDDKIHRNAIAGQILVDIIKEIRAIKRIIKKEEQQQEEETGNNNDFKQKIRRGGDLWADSSVAITSSMEYIREIQKDVPHNSKAVYSVMGKLADCVMAISQLGQLRFQSRGLAFLDTLSFQPPGRSTHDDTSSEGRLVSIPPQPRVARLLARSMVPAIEFEVGQVVQHRLFGFRGVIVGYDLRPTRDTSSWEGVVGLTLGQEQPFYRVVPDERDIRGWLGPNAQRQHYYVAQQNLIAVTEPSRQLIQHPQLSICLFGFDAEKHKFRIPHQLKYCFPSGPHALPDDFPATSVLSNWRRKNEGQGPKEGREEREREILENEIAIYEGVDRLLIQLRDTINTRLMRLVHTSGESQSADLKSLLTLLKEAPSYETALTC
eukprot:gene3796-4146_t